MAMNMAGSAGGGGRRGRRRAAVMAEINVTPMVDVMLVLLIIFMVAAPLMTSTIDIDLPIASGGKSLAANAPPLTLSVKRTGGACNSNVELYLGDTLICGQRTAAQDQGDPGDPVGRRERGIPEGRQRRLLYGYDETIGVYSDCGVQGEYRHRSRAGLMSHAMAREG